MLYKQHEQSTQLQSSLDVLSFLLKGVNAVGTSATRCIQPIGVEVAKQQRKHKYQATVLRLFQQVEPFAGGGEVHDGLLAQDRAQADHQVPHLCPTSLHCHQHPHISALIGVAVHGYGPRAEFHGAETLAVRSGRGRVGSFLRHNMHQLVVKLGHNRQGGRVPVRGALAGIVDAEDICVDDN